MWLIKILLETLINAKRQGNYKPKARSMDHNTNKTHNFSTYLNSRLYNHKAITNISIQIQVFSRHKKQ